MKILEISITAFDHNDEVDIKYSLHTPIKESDLDRDVVMRLYTKATRTSINPNRFIWSVVKRIDVIDVIV